MSVAVTASGLGPRSPTSKWAWVRSFRKPRAAAFALAALLIAGRVYAQGYPAPLTPQIPPAAPANPPGERKPVERIPADIGGDRPRQVPEALREGRILPDQGVEVGVGANFVNITSSRLHVSQGPRDFLTDGALLSADVIFQNWRLEYSKLLLRRQLPSGTTFRGSSVDFLGVDVDQFWAFYGWRPVHWAYFGAGLGYEYRLLRLSNSRIAVLQQTSVATLTENLGVAGLIADWAVSPPITLQFRAFQEEGGRTVTLGGTAVQLGYIVPF
jgi:hypothetical protein